MKLCMIGYGSIGGFHRDAMLKMEGVEFDSVVGRLLEPAREFARTCGAAFAITNVHEALRRPELDAVLITSPSQVHYEQAKAALKAGKHVLVEIPLALSYEQAEELCHLAESQNRTLMVCHTQRFYAATMEVKRRIVEGRLTPRHFHVEFEYLRRQNVNWQGRKRSWTDNLLWHHGGHVVDLAIWLFGQQPVAARAYYGPSDNPLGIPLDLSAQMRFPNGGLATYAMSYNAIVPRERERMTLICDEDRLVWDDLRLTDHRGDVVADEPFGEAVLRQDREFIEAVRQGRGPLASGGEILHSYKCLGEMEKSALAGT